MTTTIHTAAHSLYHSTVSFSHFSFRSVQFVGSLSSLWIPFLAINRFINFYFFTFADMKYVKANSYFIFLSFSHSVQFVKCTVQRDTYFVSHPSLYSFHTVVLLFLLNTLAGTSINPRLRRRCHHCLSLILFGMCSCHVKCG